MSYYDIDGEPVTGLMAEFLKPLLGRGRRQEGETHGPQFQPGEEWGAVPEGRRRFQPDRIGTVRKWQRMIEKANAPKVIAETVGNVVTKAVAGAVEAVAGAVAAIVPEPATKIAKATAWLEAVLADGPMLERNVSGLARKAGIANRTLRRAKERAGVKSLRNPDHTSLWALPTA
jgi:hypothetical protein